VRKRLHRGMRVFGAASLQNRAFWTCFGILILLAAGYGVVLAMFLGQHDLFDVPGRQQLAWCLALSCWLFALAPLWLLARVESRWIMRHVREPIAAVIRQCSEIRAGRAVPRLRHRGDDELAGLADAVNDLIDHFNQDMLCQHQFAADAAHELRTPLTAQSVVGENALARRCSGAELREAVGSMLEESNHMKRLIENLLELTRAAAVGAAEWDATRQPMRLELGKLALGCVDSLQILAEEKHQRIELDAAVVWVDADATMVRQALLNVIHNAIEHCPDGACIQVVTARFARDLAMVRVTDDGPGIPVEQQPHIFKRFHRVTGASGRRGLGLGLAIAKAIMKSQRGNIFVRSEPYAGCSFTLTLPRLVERAPTKLPAAPAIDTDAPRSGFESGETVPLKG
jgi:signal transduction histidine kinase